jgi:peptide/nickel transport system permease protein
MTTMSTSKPAPVTVTLSPSQRSWVADVFADAAHNKLVIVGFVMITFFVLVAIFAPYIMPYPPDQIIGADRLKPPGIEHFFGADHLGRDVFSRVMLGVRTSLVVSLSSVFFGSVIGAVLGLVTGFMGGLLDTAVSRILDIFFGIPTLLLAIVLSGVLGSGVINAILAIIIVNIPFFARLVRGPTLAEKEQQYVLSAQALGASKLRIMFRHLLPNLVPVVIVQATVSLSYAILIEAALGFVGLGVQPPTPSLGSMLSEGRTFLELAPWFSIFPGLTIMLMVLSFNLTGDGLRDALDPSLRNVR